ncbi:hypothetical protein RJ641_010470 [Dillenia turbinata]|uniref:Uncharacterized protein n=1 Tax=Dillenia turbinata TaxID=194707 RepID=A0AAN8Z6G7_9MAGN
MPTHSCAKSANLVAQKSKGMPLIKISLNKLISPGANAAMSNLALKLFETLRSTQDSCVKEQKRSCDMTELLSAEQERNESLQCQLNSLLYSKRQKVQNATENTNNSSQPKSSDYLSSTASKNLSCISAKVSVIVKEKSLMFLSAGKLANQDVASTKTCNRVVPAYRRTKVRGALLQDVEDGDN